MNLAVKTGIYGQRPPEEVARLAATAGFDAVVLELDASTSTLTDGSLTAALADRLERAFEQAGVAIAALAIPAELPAASSLVLQQLAAVMPLLTHLGTDVVLVNCGPGDDWTAVLEPLQEALREADERQAIVVLAVGAGSALAVLDDLETLLDAVDSEYFRLALHLGPLAAANGLSGQEVLERVGDALELVYLDPAPAADNWLAVLVEAAPETILVVTATTPAEAAAARAHLTGSL